MPRRKTLPATKENASSKSDSLRELMVQVWYPARAVPGKTASYLFAPALLKAMKQEEYLDVGAATLQTWSRLPTHALLDAPLIASPQRLPVLLFLPGFGVSRVSYTSLVEEFASRGFVVVALDSPYAGLTVLPDGRVLSFSDPHHKTPPAIRVEEMAQDAGFVLSSLCDARSPLGRFTHRIDRRRVGIFGHSLGGAVALEIGRTDARFQACADLDGDTWGKVDIEGVHRPYLVMLNVPGPPIHIPDAMRQQRDSQWAGIVSKTKTPAFLVKIQNTTHFSFSDLPFVVPRNLLAKNGGTLAPERGHQIICTLLRTFFLQEWETGKSNRLKQISQSYPEVILASY